MESEFRKIEKGYDGSLSVVMELGHPQCTHAFARWSRIKLRQVLEAHIYHVGRILKRLKL